jgi:hypothetical protein
MALHFKENREMNKINQLDDFAPRIMALYDERLQTWVSRMNCSPACPLGIGSQSMA